MAQTCGQCGKVVYRMRFMAMQKKWLGFDCGCLAADRVPRTTLNPFKIRFDHVADEFGNHLEVENIRQLEAAEKRLGFQSVVLNSDAQNFDDPPQQREVTVSDLVKRKFSQVRQRYA